MIEKEFIVNNKLGLHLRPATELVRRISNFKAAVQFIKDDEVADGKSVISLMTMVLTYGDKVKVIVDGEDEVEVMKIIEDFFGNNFNFQLEDISK